MYPVYQFEGVEGGYPQYQADFRQYGDQYMQVKYKIAFEVFKKMDVF